MKAERKTGLVKRGIIKDRNKAYEIEIFRVPRGFQVFINPIPERNEGDSWMYEITLREFAAMADIKEAYRLGVRLKAEGKVYSLANDPEHIRWLTRDEAKASLKRCFMNASVCITKLSDSNLLDSYADLLIELAKANGEASLPQPNGDTTEWSLIKGEHLYEEYGYHDPNGMSLDFQGLYLYNHGNETAFRADEDEDDGNLGEDLASRLSMILEQDINDGSISVQL